MRYQIRQKAFSFGDDFAIRDESGESRFQVDGKVLAIGDKLSITDMAGREVAFIRQRLLSWGPSYEISRDGELLATVKKQLFTFFRCAFSVDVPGPDDLEATGGFLDHNYIFTRGGQEVASVGKRWVSFTDSYGIDIADGEDEILILASVIVIDLCCHDDKKR